MSSIIIQFHASVEEILAFVDSTSMKLGLTSVLLQKEPFNAKSLQSHEDAISSIDNSKRTNISIALLQDEALLTANSRQEFKRVNSSAVLIDIGNETKFGLQESSLSFGSDNEEFYRIAKKIAARLKRITKAGAIAINPDTGAEAIMRSFRYSAGAKEKYDKGGTIRPVAGKCILKLP